MSHEQTPTQTQTDEPEQKQRYTHNDTGDGGKRLPPVLGLLLLPLLLLSLLGLLHYDYYYSS